MKQAHSSKFVDKYMKFAQFIAGENETCGSRKVGAVIVDQNNKIRGIGYNGPPAGTPHCNDPLYLTTVVKPLLTQSQSESLARAYGDADEGLLKCTGCPRRFLGYKSGDCPEMCSCLHAEANALINAACDVSGCTMFCTLSPCVNCVGLIINARIAELYFPSGPLYHPQVEFLLEQSSVQYKLL